MVNGHAHGEGGEGGGKACLHIKDGRMLMNDLLNFSWRYIFPAANDHVFQPTHNPAVPMGVQHSYVPGVHPPCFVDDLQHLGLRAHPQQHQEQSCFLCTVLARYGMLLPQMQTESSLVERIGCVGLAAGAVVVMAVPRAVCIPSEQVRLCSTSSVQAYSARHSTVTCRVAGSSFQ